MHIHTYLQVNDYFMMQKYFFNKIKIYQCFVFRNKFFAKKPTKKVLLRKLLNKIFKKYDKLGIFFKIENLHKIFNLNI